MLRSFLLLSICILLFSCSGSNDSPEAKPIKFDRVKWDAKTDGKYTYRNQMIYDLLNNHSWKGLSTDSLYRKLGWPDEREGAELFYLYDSKPFLGGLATTIETFVIELSADSTVKEARLNDGGWD